MPLVTFVSGPECSPAPGKRRRAGYVILLIAAGMAMLAGFAGLALDLGYAEYYKRRVQVAADAGAIGAIQEFRMNGTTNVVTAAKQDVTTNGFTDGANGATVSVKIPPATGAYAGNARYVEVTVTKQVPTSFMSMLNFSSVTVAARSVGGLGDSPYCILALDPLLPAAINVWGSAVVSAPGCAVVSDSSDPAGLTVGGSGCLTAGEIDVVGGYTAKCASPTPSANQPYVYDPLAYLAEPSVGACDKTNYKTSKAAILNPGVYCGGITIDGSGNDITFNPGMYILYGGGMTVHGGNNLSGAGVTFYNTGTVGGSYPYGQIWFNGNSHLVFSAPTSGTYEGVLFFQDRSYAGGAQILGDNTSTIDGVIYAPAAQVTFTGNSSANGYTSIVADTVVFTGSSTLKSNYGSLADGNPLKGGILSE